MTSEEKEREEKKREAALERWRVIPETIAWADSQATGGRNVPANRLKEQERKLRQLEEDRKREK